jgi:ribosomal protein S18 acetylase RimI-like enzyme
VPPSARRGTTADLDAAAATLAAAFAGYVWSDWTIATADQEARLREGFALMLRHVVVPHGELWVTDDLASAAVWFPPGRREEISAAFAAIDERLTDLAGDRAAAAERADRATAAAHPPEPHWYLASMGTRPERQGEGLGTAALAPVLERLDRRGELAYAETSTRDNVAFYERRGFEVLRELELGEGAPPVWTLLRRPRRHARRPDWNSPDRVA